jgi:hypothetical protein
VAVQGADADARAPRDLFERYAGADLGKRPFRGFDEQ